MRLKRTALRISEEMQALFKIVAMFTPRQFQIARLMTQQEEFTIAGVARVMELSAQNVRQQIHRLTREVRARLRGEWWVPVRRKGRLRYGAQEREYQWTAQEEEERVTGSG